MWAWGIMMNKKYIHIYQCQMGDVLAYDLYDDYGFLIVSKHMVIDQHIIKRMETFRIRQLSVYEMQNTEYNGKTNLQ